MKDYFLGFVLLEIVAETLNRNFNNNKLHCKINVTT